MSKPDINLVSFSGKRPLGENILLDLTPSQFPAIADTLKVTDCANGSIKAGAVTGGYEDCLDVNNKSENIQAHADLWIIKGKQGFTIKGGSKSIHVSGMVSGHGSATDVDLGNVSDQSDNLTGPVILELTHVLGPQEPVYYRVLGADDPIILNLNQKYVCTFRLWKPLRSPFLKVYKFLKKIGLPI